MRGLYLVLGYILGNESARKWCFENLKKASGIVDKEMKKIPAFSTLTEKKDCNLKKGEQSDGKSNEISLLCGD